MLFRVGLSSLLGSAFWPNGAMNSWLRALRILGSKQSWIKGPRSDERRITWEPTAGALLKAAEIEYVRIVRF